MADLNITLESEFHRPDELLKLLEAKVRAAPGALTLKVQGNESALRLDPTIVVAAITGGASVLAALVTGALALLKRPEVDNGKIVVETAAGARIEVPADTDVAKVGALLNLAERDRVTRVLICEQLP